MFIPRSLFVAVVLYGAAASAQVNTEKLRGSAQPGFHGFLDGSLLLKSGNVDLLQVGVGARLEYNASIHTPYVQGNFNFGRKGDDDDIYINNGFGHIRWTAMWHPTVGTEVFGQAQFNEFLRLNFRALGGVGVRVEALQTEPFDLVIGTGYMIEFEELDLDASDVHPAETLSHRWTSYITLRLHIQEYLSLVNVTYAQPKFDDFTDIRVLDEVALEVSIIEHLSLILSFTLAYDSDPPDGVETLDMQLKPRLKASF